ncbi:hypothetical protein HU200_006684 [Digitaria exilis]|uniref:CHCH domain-containing protein n=1 Tax=Digitaria exilis TaxID=1010633 RepID=A0A835FRT4_9POAL|nr:hypothetical protein HU200_006684 [Digitaria exilis]
MATAQAASTSPTHHRASPGTSPPQPPYPSAARIADSACFPLYTASLKCLEANQDKSKCQQQFDDYKECKKKEDTSDSRLNERRKADFHLADTYISMFIHFSDFILVFPFVA